MSCFFSSTPLESNRFNTASPSSYLSQSLSNAQLSSGGLPLSPSRLKGSPNGLDVATPKSTAPRGPSSRRSPSHDVAGTETDPAGGFFAAVAAQSGSPFNLASFAGLSTSANYPPSEQHSPPRFSDTGSVFGGPLNAQIAQGSMSISLPTPMPTRRQSAGRLRSPTSRFTPVLPSELAEYVFDEGTLILDLRPHAAFVSSAGYIINSINICVPTTLLRRATYSLSRVGETLSKPERRRLLDSLKDCDRIVVVDHDASLLHHDGMLHAMLTKYEREGFKGPLMWLKGGYAALKQADMANEFDPPLITTMSDGSGSSTSSSSFSLGNEAFNSSTSSLLSASSSSSSSRSLSHQGDDSSPVLRCRDLPVAAFQAGSTQQFINEKMQTEQQFPLGEAGFANALGGGEGLRTAAGPSSARAAANPFFDNIRQNQESLNLDRSLQDLTAFEVPRVFERDLQARSRLPAFLRELVELTPLQRADRLAREFFEIEEREQHRLQDLMKWHASRDQVAGVDDQLNPLSISAGVEKGHLNRYRNVFPYEHTRVRLAKFTGGETDYINASRIDIRDASHSFIATQGPMASSFADFWQLIYQERVGVILMLTNLREAGREKCGAYFGSGKYGKILVERVEACDAAAKEDEALSKRNSGQLSAGGFFGPATPNAATGVLRRTLRITHDDEPQSAHHIRHLHFASWPDFDIPPDANEVLSLVREVNQVQSDSRAPILAHCSAGVGRTGSYIAVDVVLDSILNPKDTPREMSVDTPGISSHGGLLPTRDRLTPPLASAKPVQAVVDEMREQRMSMVANAAQYRFAHSVILEGLAASMV